MNTQTDEQQELSEKQQKAMKRYFSPQHDMKKQHHSKLLLDPLKKKASLLNNNNQNDLQDQYQQQDEIIQQKPGSQQKLQQQQQKKQPPFPINTKIRVKSPETLTKIRIKSPVFRVSSPKLNFHQKKQEQQQQQQQQQENNTNTSPDKKLPFMEFKKPPLLRPQNQPSNRGKFFDFIEPEVKIKKHDSANQIEKKQEIRNTNSSVDQQQKTSIRPKVKKTNFKSSINNYINNNNESDSENSETFLEGKIKSNSEKYQNQEFYGLKNNNNMSGKMKQQLSPEPRGEYFPNNLQQQIVNTQGSTSDETQDNQKSTSSGCSQKKIFIIKRKKENLELNNNNNNNNYQLNKELITQKLKQQHSQLNMMKQQQQQQQQEEKISPLVASNKNQSDILKKLIKNQEKESKVERKIIFKNVFEDLDRNKKQTGNLIQWQKMQKQQNDKYVSEFSQKISAKIQQQQQQQNQSNEETDDLAKMVQELKEIVEERDRSISEFKQQQILDDLSSIDEEQSSQFSKQQQQKQQLNVQDSELDDISVRDDFSQDVSMLSSLQNTYMDNQRETEVNINHMSDSQLINNYEKAISGQQSTKESTYEHNNSNAYNMAQEIIFKNNKEMGEKYKDIFQNMSAEQMNKYMGMFVQLVQQEQQIQEQQQQ